MDDQHAYLACSTESFLRTARPLPAAANIIAERLTEPAGLKKIPLHVDDHERGAVQIDMKRREFLKSMTALTAASAVSAPAIWSPAKAQSRQETLLIVSENGPNNLDIHGVGTNVPGYEASWNCYDRLISHEMKTDCPNGTPVLRRDKFKPELAEDMNIGDMSVTFKLRKDAVSRTARRSPPRTSNGRSTARSRSAASRPSR
jgi:hypothetical protein